MFRKREYQILQSFRNAPHEQHLDDGPADDDAIDEVDKPFEEKRLCHTGAGLAGKGRLRIDEFLQAGIMINPTFKLNSTLTACKRDNNL
jgi:hypothetical protein